MFKVEIEKTNLRHLQISGNPREFFSEIGSVVGLVYCKIKETSPELADDFRKMMQADFLYEVVDGRLEDADAPEEEEEEDLEEAVKKLSKVSLKDILDMLK